MDAASPDASKFWKPWERKIASYGGLVKAIDDVLIRANQSGGVFAWRGQRDASWALHSSLYRRHVNTSKNAPDEAAIADAEETIIKSVREWGLHAHRETGRLSILRQLAMLQHYGGPTRLIDVSFNVWVAAWFAVEEPDSSDGRLFAVDVSDRFIEQKNVGYWEDSNVIPWNPHRGRKFDPKAWSTGIYAWKPSALNSRISAQSSGFIFGGVPASTKPDGSRFQFPKSPNNTHGNWTIDDGRQACCLAIRPHSVVASRGRAISGQLFTFRIAKTAKAEIRARLEKMFGYSRMSLFPDYMGVAECINKAYQRQGSR